MASRVVPWLLRREDARRVAEDPHSTPLRSLENLVFFDAQDFAFENTLARGGNAEVIAATYHGSQNCPEKVALKALHETAPLHSDEAQQLAVVVLDEVNALQSVAEHPAFVRVYGTFSICDARNRVQQHIVMEHIPGVPLEPTQAYTLEQVSHFADQLLDGLAFMHEKGFVHRDIKPENFIVDDGTLRFIDAGCVTERREATFKRTRAAGSWKYAPPEIMEGEARGRSDVYSAGLVLYELFLQQEIKGQKMGRTHEALQFEVLQEKLVTETHNKTFAREICDVLRTMTAGDPEKRIQTVVEAREKIRHAYTSLETVVASASSQPRTTGDEVQVICEIMNDLSEAQRKEVAYARRFDQRPYLRELSSHVTNLEQQISLLQGFRRHDLRMQLIPTGLYVFLAGITELLIWSPYFNDGELTSGHIFAGIFTCGALIEGGQTLNATLKNKNKKTQLLWKLRDAQAEFDVALGIPEDARPGEKFDHNAYEEFVKKLARRDNIEIFFERGHADASLRFPIPPIEMRIGLQKAIQIGYHELNFLDFPKKSYFEIKYRDPRDSCFVTHKFYTREQFDDLSQNEEISKLRKQAMHLYHFIRYALPTKEETVK